MTEKPKYGTPVVMHLGDVSRGAGWCTDGTGNMTEWCLNGPNAGAWGCIAGFGATGWVCNLGEFAAGTCTAGASVGAVP